MSNRERADRSPMSFRRSRRSVFRTSALAGGTAIAAGLAGWGRASAQRQVPEAIVTIMNKPRYASATWNLYVADVETGERQMPVLADEPAVSEGVEILDASRP